MVPAAASKNPVRSRSGAYGIGLLASGVFSVPIPAPFADISVHIIKAECVWLKTSYKEAAVSGSLLRRDNPGKGIF
jgi:hypothetical protein